MDSLKIFSRLSIIILLFVLRISSLDLGIENFVITDDECVLQNVTSSEELLAILHEMPYSDGHLKTYHNNKQYLNEVATFKCDNVKIAKIPPLLFEEFSKLTSFSATGVDLQEINRDDFKHAAVLKSLNLSGNRISSLDNMIFMHMKLLQSIDISKNRIISIHDAAFEEISGHLESINLSFNKIKEFKEKYFLLLGQDMNIHLENNEIEEIEWSNTTQADNKIGILDLDHNRIKSFDSNRLQISELFLNDNKLQKLRITSTMYVVNANNNEIEKLSFDPVLIIGHLILSQNKLSREVFASLKNASKLGILDLSSNALGDLQIDTFADMSKLEELNLSYSNLSTIPFGLFSHQKHLRTLNISHNNLGLIDYHMFTALEKLEVWDVSGNQLTKLEGYEGFHEHFPELRKIALDENNFSCEYLSELMASFKKQKILIEDPIRPLKNKASIKGIGCVEHSSSRSNIQIINGAHFNSTEQFKEIVELVNSLSLQVDSMKINEGNFNELFSSLQKNLSQSQNEKMKNPKINETTLEGIRVIVEQINNATSAKQKLLIDQMLHKIDEQNLEIKKQKLEIQKISMGPNTDIGVTSEALSASYHGLSNLEVILLMMLSVVLILFAALGMIHIKGLIKSNIQRAQESARITRMNSSNTIATFDNSSV